MEISDEPKTPYCVKKEENAQREMRDVKWTEVPVRKSPIGHSFIVKKKESSSLLKDANKCRRNNGIRKSPFVINHSNNCY